MPKLIFEGAPNHDLEDVTFRTWPAELDIWKLFNQSLDNVISKMLTIAHIWQSISIRAWPYRLPSGLQQLTFNICFGQDMEHCELIEVSISIN